MSGQKTTGTVFVDDSVDTRAPTRSPDAPVSSGDIIGANWTLTRQDFMGANNQAEMDAYLPIIAELDKNDDRSAAAKIFVPSRYFNVDARGGNNQVNKQTVWDSIAARRAADPNFLKDIPAKNADEFTAWVTKQEQGRRAVASDIARRESGLGQKALGFGTGAVSSLADPINFGLSLMTMGSAGGGKTLLGSMAREAAINSAIETVELPGIAHNRSQFGEQMTPLDMVADVGMAGVGGAAFPVAGRVGHIIAAPVLEPIGRALDPLFDPMRQRAAERALGIADLPAASDTEVLRAFTERFPLETRTPDAQAAINVLDREADVRGASPYIATPGGLDANAERLATVSDVLSQPASAGNTPPRPQPVARSAPPLTQDGIIRFVLNDLEGGAKVVPFSQADGGTTKYGVAKKFNPDVDVANITEADAMRIARQRYWLPEFNNVDPRVAAIAFDANWISSPTLARKIIREAGNDVNRALEIYRARLMEIADTVPGKAKWRKGWNNRVDKLAHYLGDAEPSAVRLAPEQFNGDDVAYRAAQEQLNSEELRLADDTPREPDPVREFVDRQLAGDDLTAASDRQFASINADQISAEVARRAELGTDFSPRAVSPEPIPPTDISAPGPTETALAVRQYVERGMGEATPEAIARDLGIDRATAARDLVSAQSAIATRVERLAAFDAATASLDTIKPTDQRKLWHVQVGDNTQVVSSIESARREVLSAARDAGTYDNVFDKVMKWDGRPRKFGGIEVKRLSEGQREAAARQHIEAMPVAEEPSAAPPSLDPKAYGVDSPTDMEAHLLADSAYHDVRALAEAGGATKAQLVEGGPEMGAKELIESIDRDQSALDAIKGCL